MKTMKTMNPFRMSTLLAMLFLAIIITSCSSDDDQAPEEENEVEVITNLSLIFTNTADASDIVSATAVDADGAGIGELVVLESIDLAADTEYTLTYSILNALNPDDVEDIAEEIEEEDFDHQIFYGFTEDIFASPVGDGNIDSSSDAVNYNDEDVNGNPVGLSTTWTTAATASTGIFTTRLQHQPDLKSATTGASDGDTDFNLTFTINIE